MRASHTKCAEDSIPEGDDYGLKSALFGRNDLPKITGRTNLFYLSIDFLKGGKKEGTGSNLFCLV